MTGRDPEQTRAYNAPIHRLMTVVLAIGFSYGDSSVLIAEGEPQPRIAKRVATRPTGDAHKLAAVLDIARKCREQMKTIEDYEAKFQKKELIGDRLLTQTTQIKFRKRPFSVYLKFETPHSGREVIYVQGKNDSKLLVHGTGIESLVGTLSLSPTSPDAMQENRYPITMIGLSKMLDQVIQQWDAESQSGDMQVKYYPNARIGQVACRVIETSHPHRVAKVKFHMTRLYIDQKSKLAIRVEQYGFPKNAGDKPPLIEQYTYSDLRTNVSLTDRDFDTSNSKYNY